MKKVRLNSKEQQAVSGGWIRYAGYNEKSEMHEYEVLDDKCSGIYLDRNGKIYLVYDVLSVPQGIDRNYARQMAKVDAIGFGVTSFEYERV